MGILDKVMFWKKKDEFADIGLGDKDNLAFGDDFGAGTPKVPGAGQTGLGQPEFTPPSIGMGSGQSYSQQYPQPQGFPQTPSMPSAPSYPQQFQQPQPSFGSPQEMASKNLEIISSKLDALRASIESLNQRLANLEAIARGEQDYSRGRKYY
ncbi:hypothetical protein KY347_02245 [Candidatus Woesearchaeota archaeon]|nr:hypothetical protein [Candidatus Woesearchaeota archaeon]